MTKKRSNRRNRKVSKRLRKQASRKQIKNDYQSLEPRQLLTADIGLQFSGTTFGVDTNSIFSNVQGDAGFDHYVEVAEGGLLGDDRAAGR